MKTWLVASVMLLMVAVPETGISCSTFQISHGVNKVFGKSYDWHADHGLVIANKAGLQKSAIDLRGTGTPATWTSRFGSLTFSQHGQDMPLGGLNEAGLVVEIMILGGSSYPRLGSRPMVNELQWIQYILDTSATVEEAQANAQAVDIDRLRAGVHYLVCDLSGDCATFEYINRRLTIHSGDRLPAGALTNSTYAQSADYLAEHVGFGGNRRIPTSNSSLDRFVRVAAKAKSFDGSAEEEVEAAGNILDSVQMRSTVWQIVYNPGEGEIVMHHVATGERYNYALRNHDFSCAETASFRDLDGDVTGQVDEEFAALSYATNHDLVDAGNRSLGSMFSAGQVAAIARHPQTFRCVESID